MGRPFSVFAIRLAAVLMLMGALHTGAQQACAQEVFFSMIFPQLMPEWAWAERSECATPEEALPADGLDLGEVVRL